MALLTTMTLGGLWHGAGVTFILWGVVHGLGLCEVLLWRRAQWPCPAPVGWALTFVFVMLAWVLFRAPTLDGALTMYQALFGFAPAGDGFKWRAIVAAAPVALLFLLVLLKIGDDANFEFIYFQF
jgi:D-alanyl-lipoteichoic acid acyltransferase DltB (MBOAT superfamily)